MIKERKEEGHRNSDLNAEITLHSKKKKKAIELILKQRFPLWT